MKDSPGGSPVPDVEALMQRVRSGLADQIGRGVYTPADLEEVRLVEEELRRCADSGPAPADDLARVNASRDPLGPHAFTSHRAGVGALVVTAKKMAAAAPQTPCGSRPGAPDGVQWRRRAAAHRRLPRGAVP